MSHPRPEKKDGFLLSLGDVMEQWRQNRSDRDNINLENIEQLAGDPEIIREQFAFFPNPQCLMNTTGIVCNVIEERSADDSDDKDLAEYNRTDAILKSSPLFRDLLPEEKSPRSSAKQEAGPNPCSECGAAPRCWNKVEEKYYCINCGVAKILKTPGIDEVLTADELYRKTCLTEFLKKINTYRQQLSQGVSRLDTLDVKCDRHFETEILRLNDTFKSLIKEIQQCYAAIFRKLEGDVNSNKKEVQKSRQKSSEILGELLNTKQDVEENFEKIVLRMDLAPFSEIMESYSSKMKSIEVNLEDLTRYDCDLAQLEENKDFMHQIRHSLRNIFTLKNLSKHKHKKFNSEEVMFEDADEVLASSVERIEMFNRLRQSNETSKMSHIPQIASSSSVQGIKLPVVWNLSAMKESSPGLDVKIQQQLRKITAELITDNLGVDKVLQNEARELINRIDQVVSDKKRPEHGSVQHMRQTSNDETVSQTPMGNHFHILPQKNSNMTKSESHHMGMRTEQDHGSHRAGLPGRGPRTGDEYGKVLPKSNTVGPLTTTDSPLLAQHHILLPQPAAAFSHSGNRRLPNNRKDTGASNSLTGSLAGLGHNSTPFTTGPVIVLPQKHSITNSVISNKSKDSTRGVASVGHNGLETGAQTPNTQNNEKLGKFLKKHFTQSDLKSIAGTKTVDGVMGTDSKSRGPTELHTQRSESKASERAGSTHTHKHLSAGGFGMQGGARHDMSSLSNPGSAKKAEPSSKETPASRSDYFTNLLDIKLGLGGRGVNLMKNASAQMIIDLKGGMMLNQASAAASKKQVSSSASTPVAAASGGPNSGGKSIINLTRFINPSVGKEGSPSRSTPVSLIGLANGGSSVQLRSPGASISSDKKHLEAAESALQRIASAPKNNFLIPKYSSKKAPELLKRLSTGGAGNGPTPAVSSSRHNFSRTTERANSNSSASGRGQHK